MYTPHRRRTLACLLTLLMLSVAVAACERVAGNPAGSPLAPTPTTARPPSGPTATAPAAPSGTPIGNDNVKVARPAAKQEVRSPLTLQGQARVFEGNVQFALKDARGQIMASGFTTATKGAPDWGDYKAELAFRVTARQEATLEVFTLNARDGSPQFLVALPVTLLPG